MSKLLTELSDHVLSLTLNYPEKHNAFDDNILGMLDQALDEAQHNSDVRVIVLKANGRHFSAGADLAWMKRMVNLSEADNHADALRFAHVLHKLYQIPKPTIALVQGATYGGGIGLIAACDIAFAAETAKFCFSEVSLGLIPAVISPYIIQAIGARAATALFLSAEVFHAPEAHRLQLIHTLVKEEDLLKLGLEHAKRLAHFPKQALQQAKSLVRTVQDQAINDTLLTQTAELIAKIRVSTEAQDALHLFLNQSSGTR
ncbi:MAG: gamma-carboxygeranoyl-CoA hydratase [Legionella sp.]|nr:MAG: gamma-carboxygeranoyl-CoA hydratase [Legionella sp.]